MKLCTVEINPILYLRTCLGKFVDAQWLYNNTQDQRVLIHPCRRQGVSDWRAVNLSGSVIQGAQQELQHLHLLAQRC